MGPDLAAVAHDQEYGYFNMFVEGTMKRISETATKVTYHSSTLLPIVIRVVEFNVHHLVSALTTDHELRY
jgi:hypothetical protein